MIYADARLRIKSGDVLAFSHRPIRSWYDLQIAIVRAFTRSEYSHVGIAYRLAGRVFILEAVSSGIRIYPLSRCGAFYWIPRLRMTVAEEVEALLHVGAPYSKWEALKAFFGKSDDTNDQWQCSEYVAHVLSLPIENQTPAEVVRYLLDTEGRTLRYVG